MGWLNSFKKQDSALLNLSKKVFENSLLCAESLRKDLEEKYGKGSKEFHSKYTMVLFEFMYFFLHLTNRSAFKQLGQEKRNKLLEELGPVVADAATETLFGHWPQNLKDGIKRDFYDSLDNSEMEYASCKQLLVKLEDDTPILEKIASGKKSKSMVGQLVDNLSQIITGDINTNAFFTLQIWDVVIDILKKKEIDPLVLAVSKEIE
jgi:hypothetical protein